MKGCRIGNGFIDYSLGDFECPWCKYHHTDEDEKYYHKMDKSEYGEVRVRCQKCKKLFWITSDYMGNVHGFLKKIVI